MKKLMIVAAVAVCAAVGVKADVESSNIVGYTKKAARANLNWYAPHFLTGGVNTIDINTVRLIDGGAGMVGWGDSMQIVGPLGNPAEMYSYWDPSMDLSGEATECYWGDAEGNPVSVSFDAGAGIALDNGSELEYEIFNSGDVSTEDVSFEARPNLNWSGNPFPVAINLNAIRLDDGGAGVVGWGDSMQIVGPLGNPAEMYSYWDPSMDLSGEATECYWGDAEGNPVDVTLEPGAGFAIDNGSELTFTINITCPYAKK